MKSFIAKIFKNKKNNQCSLTIPKKISSVFSTSKNKAKVKLYPLSAIMIFFALALILLPMESRAITPVNNQNFNENSKIPACFEIDYTQFDYSVACYSFAPACWETGMSG